MAEERICGRCNVPMQALGDITLRTGGATGLGGMLLGNLNQLAEKKLPVQACACPQCRRLEFYLRV